MTGSITDCSATSNVISTGTSGQNIGGIVGKTYGSRIENCHSTGMKISGASSYIGGVVGNASGNYSIGAYLYMKNCTSTATVSGMHYIGGVVGRAEHASSITDCYSTGESVNGSIFVGGVAGYALGDRNISVVNCYSTADVIGTGDYVGGVVGGVHTTSAYVTVGVESCYSTGSVRGASYIGGVAGQVNYGGWSVNCFMKNCYTEGDVVGTGGYIGGVVGYVNGSVTECYSKATIVSGTENCIGGVAGTAENVTDCTAISDVISTGISGQYIGGIAGYTWSSVENCHTTGTRVSSAGDNIGGVVGYAVGNVTNCSATATVSGLNNVGGVVGRAQYNTSMAFTSPSVTKCYSTGESVSGMSYIGGVVGSVQYGYIRVANCYSTSNVVGTSNYIGGIAGYLYNDYGSILENCYSTGEVSSDGQYIGGIVWQVIRTSYYGNSIVSDCVALNSSVKGTMDTGRVAGNHIDTLSRNMAFDGMCNKAGTSEWNRKGANNHDGEDIEIVAAMSITFWIDTMNWDFYDVWHMVPGYAFPQLRGLPLPGSSDPGSGAEIEVSLPAPTTSLQYDNMKITLINKTRNTQFTISVTDKLSYSFKSLSVGDVYQLTLTNRHENVLSKIDNIAVVEGMNRLAFTELIQTRPVSIKICDNTGIDVTSQCIIQWYNELGGYLTQGDKISDVAVGMRLQYKVELSSILGSQFINPTSSKYVVTDGNNYIEIALSSIPTVTISGTVRNSQTDATLFNATVSISQILNGKHPRTVVARTNSNGAFTAQVFNEASTITASGNNFFNQVITKPGFSGNENLGEIRLTPITGAMITLDMSYRYSALPGETRLISALPPDYQNLRFSVYNHTQNQAITNFVYQYPYLILPDTASSDDTVCIIVSGGSFDFNHAETNVTLDNSLTSTASITLVQHGSLKATYASSANAENVVLVYNSQSQLVKAYDFRFKNVDTDPLPDGSYTVVFMGKSLFFNSIQNLSDLSAAGLVENTDYTLRQMEIASGLVNWIDGVSIPRFDEGKFSCTDNDRTLFSVNKTSAVVGAYFVLRNQLAFRDIYKDQISDVKLIVQLPENCGFVEASVVYGSNNTLAMYALNSNTLTIPLINVEDVIRFCVIPTRAGRYAPNAFVEFTMDGETLRQPIGVAEFEAKEMKFIVPEKTSQKWVTVNGTTQPGSEVIVFSNGVEVGRTKPLLNGNWKLTFDLIKPYSYTTHIISAEVILSQEAKILSEKKTLKRIDSFPDLSKVTMIYPIRDTSTPYDTIITFDFLNPSGITPSYRYWPANTSFTFVVEFTDKNPDLISDVRVNVATISGKTRVLQAIYDSRKQIWIASGNFGSNEIPINVGVDYSTYFEYILSTELEEEINDLWFAVDWENVYPNLKCEELLNTFDEATGIITGEKLTEITDVSLEGVVLCVESSVKEVSQQYVDSIADESETGSWTAHMPLKDSLGRQHYFKIGSNETRVVLSHIYSIESSSKAGFRDASETRFYEATISAIADIPDEITDIADIIDVISWFVDDPDLEKLNDILGPIATVISFGKTKVEYEEANRRIEELRQKANRLDEPFRSAINEALDQAAGYNYSWKGGTDLANLSGLIGGPFKDVSGPFSKFYELAFSIFKHAREGKLDLIERGINIIANCNDLSTQTATQMFMSFPPIKNSQAAISFSSMEKNCFGDDPSEGQDVHPIIDPAGYVYEAVASNRLPGVTTTAFYKTIEEDMYGDENEVIKFWYASEYGQQNPLVTNEVGWYEWDVPIGQWMVKYEKEGYQTAYSTDIYGWLPVPPPQLEVHVGMTSYAKPNIVYVNGYEDYIEVVFDRYMNITTINDSNVLFERNCEPIEIEIKFVNEEADPTDETRNYVQIIHIKPITGRLDISDEVVLTIKKTVATYGIIFSK